MGERERDLRCHPDPYEAIRRGEKLHEFRLDDREPRYEVGDVLKLREWDGQYTGRWTRVRVTYVSRGPDWGIPLGYCCMSIKRLTR